MELSVDRLGEMKKKERTNDNEYTRDYPYCKHNTNRANIWYCGIVLWTRSKDCAGVQYNANCAVLHKKKECADLKR